MGDNRVCMHLNPQLGHIVECRSRVAVRAVRGGETGQFLPWQEPFVGPCRAQQDLAKVPSGQMGLRDTIRDISTYSISVG